MWLLRAPVLAVALFAVVVVGAIVDDGSGDASGADVHRSHHQNAVVKTSVPVRTTIVVPPPTTSTTSTTVWVEGDDDPGAIDDRSWTWDELADCESGSWGANKVPIAG